LNALGGTPSANIGETLEELAMVVCKPVKRFIAHAEFKALTERQA